MIYYKNFEDALTEEFERLGIKDGNGNLVKSTGKPISKAEHTEIRMKKIRQTSSRMTVTIERNGVEYIPYGEEWTKELMKLTKSNLKLLASENGLTALELHGLTKKQIIEKYRSRLLVDKFNKNVAVGTSFNWRPAIGEPYQKVTTRSKAFVSKNNGLPLVFVSEKSAYISIEPEFVMSFF